MTFFCLLYSKIFSVFPYLGITSLVVAASAVSKLFFPFCGCKFFMLTKYCSRCYCTAYIVCKECKECKEHCVHSWYGIMITAAALILYHVFYLCIFIFIFKNYKNRKLIYLQVSLYKVPQYIVRFFNLIHLKTLPVFSDSITQQEIHKTLNML